MAKKNKKGQSQYLSWIIIIAMIVAISFFLYNWSLDQARRTSEELTKQTDPLVCAEVGISIQGICQTFRSLKINITNTNNYEIEGFLFRTVGLYPEDDNYLDSSILNKKISPGDSEKIIVLKKGTLSKVQIIPFTLKNNKEIYCEDQSITKEKNELKQC